LKRIVFLILFLFIATVAKAEPYRIASLAPSTTEILFALGLGDSIVGIDEYSDYPSEAKSIDRIGTFARPNIEKIILLRPDCILVNTNLAKNTLDYLMSLGVNVIKVSPKNVDELCSDIEMLGARFGKENQAKSITQDIKLRIKKVSMRIGKDRPKVFVQLFDDPLVTVSFFIGDAIRLAGGENIAWDVKSEAGLFSVEQLIERNPDIIIAVGFSKDMLLPSSINAVKNNRIYKDINPNILLRPGPRIIEGIEELNRIFYEKD